MRYEAGIAVMPDRIVESWNVSGVDKLTATDVEALIELKAELVLLGTGDSLRFPDMRLLATLAAAGIGLEVMDTKAACRTYNILSEEGRDVAAALIIEAA